MMSITWLRFLRAQRDPHPFSLFWGTASSYLSRSVRVETCNPSAIREVSNINHIVSRGAACRPLVSGGRKIGTSRALLVCEEDEMKPPAARRSGKMPRQTKRGRAQAWSDNQRNLVRTPSWRERVACPPTRYAKHAVRFRRTPKKASRPAPGSPLDASWSLEGQKSVAVTVRPIPAPPVP